MERPYTLVVPALLFAAFIIGTASLPFPKTAAAVTPEHPVIIVPTTLGSFPSDNGPVLDPIFHTYDNLIETFVQNGYTEGSTLFVLEYDWQQSMEETAQELADLVEEAKTSCPGCTASTTVDIIGHGQGGLVAWKYLSEPANAENANTSIFLGAPLRGAVGAYVGAEGGEFILHSSAWGQQIGQALLDAQAQEGGFADTFAYVQAEVPALTQLLPVDTYLFNVGSDYPDGHPENSFLDGLWNNPNFPTITTFAGIAPNENTPTGYDVTLPSPEPPKWEHGKPSDPFLSEGDGIAIFITLADWVPIDETYAAKNFSLPTAAQADIFELLAGEAPSVVVEESFPIECALFVHAHGGVDMQITDQNGDRLGKDFDNDDTLDEIEGSFYSGYEEGLEYAIIVNPEGLYDVSLQGTESSAYTINSVLACGEDEGEAVEDTETGTTEPGEEDELDLEVEDGGVVLDPDVPDPEPGDTGAPSVSITSPAMGATHTQDEEVFAAATINDPEGSAIASTTYMLNGDIINPAVALPLESEPLGAAIVAVSATDAAGNTGSSSVTFTIAAAPSSDTTAPVIKITHPKKFDVFARDEHVFITATVTDDSPLATTTYWFNGKKVNPALKLPFNSSTPFISKAMVSATDIHGNSATSTVPFLVVKNKNSCLLDIIAIFIAILYSHEFPDKPTLEQLIDNCRDHFKKKKKEWR